MKKILVTGGAGFIGTNFCIAASKLNYKITAIDNLSRKGVEKNLPIIKSLKNVKYKYLDIRHPLPKSLGKFDYIVHLASSCSTPKSLDNPVEDFLDNSLGTLNVLEYSRINGKTPILFASTCKVYTTELNYLNLKKVDEDGPIDPKYLYSRAPYGVSKRVGELYIQEYFKTYGVPSVINRMSAVFGKYQRGSPESGFLSWFIDAKLHNLPVTIFGDGNQSRDMVWGEDVAKLFIEQIKNFKKHNGKIYNIGGGPKNEISLIQLVNYLNKNGKQLKIIFRKERKADLKRYVTNLDKITKNSKWKPTTNVYKGIDILMSEKDL